MAIVLAALRAQFQQTQRNIMDVYWLIVMPFFAIVFTSIVLQSGRTDLVGHSLVAPLLIAVGQMGFYTASELLAREREAQTLELNVAAPVSFGLVLGSKITVITSLGLLGFLESWLVTWLVFGIAIPVHHPVILVATLLATTFASTATALITAAIFSLSREVRAAQNSITYPLYVLGGVLVPVSYLPESLQPISRIIFLYWSADLLRDALRVEDLSFPFARLSMIVLLGLASGALGAWLLYRMLDHLRKEGTLGLA
jgi:ABC-2 type transport system permease protein